MREPPEGPKKLRYIAPGCTFPKILSILPTLVPAVLELQNFPGPLAFRITIYMVLAPAGQLFINIWPRGREIFKIFCKNPEHSHAVFASICPTVVLIKYCCSTKKAISVSTSHIDILLKGECTFPGAWAPRQGPKNWDISHQIALFQKFCPFCRPWRHSIFCYRIFLDLSLSESQSTRS